MVYTMHAKYTNASGPEDAEVTDRDRTALLLRDWLVRPLKSVFSLIAIVGVADIDPPAIAFDRVDGVSALDQ
jgi:hypothetical protein